MNEQEAVIKKIVAAFAETRLIAYDCNENPYCPFCEGHEDMDAVDLYHHADDCLIMQARSVVKFL